MVSHGSVGHSRYLPRRFLAGENDSKKNQETFHMKAREYAEFENEEKELKFKERRGCNSLLQTNMHDQPE